MDVSMKIHFRFIWIYLKMIESWRTSALKIWRCLKMWRDFWRPLGSCFVVLRLRVFGDSLELYEMFGKLWSRGTCWAWVVWWYLGIFRVVCRSVGTLGLLKDISRTRKCFKLIINQHPNLARKPQPLLPCLSDTSLTPTPVFVLQPSAQVSGQKVPRWSPNWKPKTLTVIHRGHGSERSQCDLWPWTWKGRILDFLLYRFLSLTDSLWRTSIHLNIKWHFLWQFKHFIPQNSVLSLYVMHNPAAKSLQRQRPWWDL